MTKYAQSRRQLSLIFTALLFGATVPQVRAQVLIPPLRSAPRVLVYATYTGMKPDKGYWGDYAVQGGTLGVFMQTHTIFGLDARATAVRYGGKDHQEAILAGPRAAIHVGRIAPYAAFLVGPANAWWYHNFGGKNVPTPKLNNAICLEWSVVGGADLYLGHGFSARAGELSYGKVYATNRTLTPVSGSVGFVYRIH